MTVLEAIQLSSDFLQKKGIVSPRLNAELLLSEILSVKRLDLYLKFDRPLSNDEVNKYRDFLVRRGKSEPLQYIIGHVEFYGLKFFVSPEVLIPRSDTEILVEESIKLIKANSDNIKILEVGTGSGNIPIALAVNCPNAEITSIDISAKALHLAKKNAEINSVLDKIIFLNENIYNFSTDKNKFDIVVSNPPYISKIEIENLNSEVINFEPRIALTDEADGLSFYKLMINRAALFLKKGGRIIFEIGFNQASLVSDLLAANGFKNIYSIKDYSGIERVICGELI